MEPKLSRHKYFLVRILALTKDNCGVDFKIKSQLMSASFPSIWVEVQDKFKEKSIKEASTGNGHMEANYQYQRK